MDEGEGRRCNLCGAAGMEMLYRSEGPHSLTSLCQLRPGGVRVFLCGACGHLASDAFEDVEAFYENDYRILVESAEEDQIYEVADGRIVYRTDHQMAVLEAKVPLESGMRVLDYGCAKAEMSRRLCQSRPGLDLHLFDVSHSYVPFWDRFVHRDRRAIHDTPGDWNGRFDLVTSYFAFEHIPDPAAAIGHVRSLLSDDGLFYAVVPDVFGNTADFIVADHVNHFTRASLTRLLSDAGFGAIEIDATAHRGAFVVTARKGGAKPEPAPGDRNGIAARARAIAAYWRGAGERLAEAEAGEGGAPAAIYGAGFYGAFIYAHLARPENVTCFLDRNPFQQGRSLFGKPILPPADLPSAVETLYVGLNPAIARRAIADTGLTARNGLSTRFLD